MTLSYNLLFSDTKTEMLEHIARTLADTINTSLENQDQFRLVIGGGRTQEALNKRLVSLAGNFKDWKRVIVYMSDERCVPLYHEQSNFGMNLRTLVKPLNLSPNNIHGVNTELSPQKAARRYAKQLEAMPRIRQDQPFDLALLGLGTDGHTASLFPGSPALDEKKNLAAAAGPDPQGLQRVTLTYPALNAAGKVWIMAAGKEKRTPVTKMLNGPYDPRACPAQGVRPGTGDITLWLDSDSAG